MKIKLLQAFERPENVRTPLPCITTLSSSVLAAIALNAVGENVHSTFSYSSVYWKADAGSAAPMLDRSRKLDPLARPMEKE
jgi:hypothetical protein